MHELSLAHSMVELIEEAARRDGFLRARVVRLQVGALACVDPQALRLAFDAACTGSCAEGAELVVVPVQGIGHCPACGHQADMLTLYDLCPACEQAPLRVVTGTELRVLNLDVE